MHAQATIGFGFTSDWLKKWRENFEPSTELSNSLITLKTALNEDRAWFYYSVQPGKSRSVNPIDKKIMAVNRIFSVFFW